MKTTEVTISNYAHVLEDGDNDNDAQCFTAQMVLRNIQEEKHRVDIMFAYVGAMKSVPVQIK